MTEVLEQVERVECPVRAEREYFSATSAEEATKAYSLLFYPKKGVEPPELEKLLHEDLVDVPMCDWISQETADALGDLEDLAHRHDASRATFEKEGRQIRTQSLATARLPDVISRRQSRLVVLRDYVAYHNEAIPCLEKVQVDTSVRVHALQTRLASLVDELTDSIVALGWPRAAVNAETIRFALNRRYGELSTACRSAQAVTAEIRHLKDGCRLAILAARNETAAIEKKIKEDLEAAAG